MAPHLVEKLFSTLATQRDRELILTPKHVAQPYLTEQYAADAEGVAAAAGAPVTSIVHVEAGWQGKGPLAAADETRWLTSLPFGRNGLPNLAAIVAQADPRKPECGTLLDAHLAVTPKVRSVRLNAAWHPDRKVKSWFNAPGLLTSRDFLAGFSALVERGLSFEATVYSNQLGDVARLAGEYPEATIVLTHCGTPIGLFGPMGSRTGWTVAQRAGIASEWRDHIWALAEHPNVVVKCSGFAFPQLGYGHESEGNIGGPKILQELWRPLIDHVTDAFGADRLMFGSNYPMDKPNATVPTLAGMLVDVLGPRGDDVLRKVFRNNALRVYGPVD
ncbi:amidohydrolase family protein [Longimycelium tulufanense]